MKEEVSMIKNIILVVVLVCTHLFAELDMDAYRQYIKTAQYQKAAALPSGGLHKNMYAEHREKDNLLDWGLTISKIEKLTGKWANLGAIAKANHENFVYVLLTPVLKNQNGGEVYRGIEVKRKAMIGNDNKISFSSPVPNNIKFSRVTISIDLITDNGKDNTHLQDKKSTPIAKETTQVSYNNVPTKIELKSSKWTDILVYALLKNKNNKAIQCKLKYIKSKNYILCDYYVGGISGYHKKALFSVSGNKIKAINGTAKQKSLLRYDEITTYNPAKDGVVDVSDILGHFN